MKKLTSKIFTVSFWLLFIGYAFWWLFIMFVSPDSVSRDWFADSYGILAGIGGAVGFFVSSKWGGLKSYVGKSIAFFSLGMVGQFLGQLSYSILFYIYHIENAYPAFGEIFYLSSIPFYVVGVLYIAKASPII